MACQNLSRTDPHAAAAVAGSTGLAGEYDNHEQVLQAGTTAVPRVRIKVTPMNARGWDRWQIDFDGGSALTAIWMMRTEQGADGSVMWIPHHRVGSEAEGKNFDQREWTALPACALRASTSITGVRALADAASCATVAPGIGAAAALLPLQVDHEGDWLRVRVYADQARGAEARAQTRRVRWFGGWAAINGAGEQASAESRDWHMNRELRLGSEGGRTALNWRDGQPSGYSLQVERLTIAESALEILKLSIIEDASGRALAYAWSDPDASRIGINLGWVQVGLQREP